MSKYQVTVNIRVLLQLRWAVSSQIKDTIDFMYYTPRIRSGILDQLAEAYDHLLRAEEVN